MLIVSITKLQPVRFGFITGPSTIVPSLHRLRVCIFKLFTPLALFSYATWSSAIFLASYSQPWICGNFNWLLVLNPVLFGFFTDPSTIVPSLHRLRTCIFKLFTPLASFSYATWTSVTFLTSYNQPWICGNFQLAVSIYSLYDLGFSQVRPRLYLHCTDWEFVFLNSLHP